MDPIIINHFGRRTKLIEMLKTRGSKYGVEVGTDHGEYAKLLLEGIPDLVLTCIDPWVAYTEGNNVHTQEEVDKIYEKAKENTAPYPECYLEKKTSMEAIKEFDNDSLDFVFIDGNHDYYHVRQDITEWTKKVRPGGIVCGHDYKEDKINDYGVIDAVNEYVALNNVAPLLILRAGGTFVDCWMFIKQ